MDVSGVLAVFQGISIALLAVGGGAVTLTIGAAGLCTMFAWLDMHIGTFIKKVFSSVLLGGTMMGGSGAFGIWLSNTMHMGSVPATLPAAPAGMILGLFGLS